MIDRDWRNLAEPKQNQARRLYPLQIHRRAWPECGGAGHCDHL
nr:MAG TPA: hypothetical protein [Caudoviricetes sp.]